VAIQRIKKPQSFSSFGHEFLFHILCKKGTYMTFPLLILFQYRFSLTKMLTFNLSLHKIGITQILTKKWVLWWPRNEFTEDFDEGNLSNICIVTIMKHIFNLLLYKTYQKLQKSICFLCHSNNGIIQIEAKQLALKFL